MNTQDIQPYLLDKLLDREGLLAKVASWKNDGLSIGFTNGVFDLLHVGHVNYLTQAGSLVDRLVVGLNSDSSVKRLNKGIDRPINPEQARALVLSGLDAVAAVCLFDEDTPLKLIEAILPDILIKGGDYNADVEEIDDPTYIVGSKQVRSNGGRTIAIPTVEGFSTTRIVEKLKS